MCGIAAIITKNKVQVAKDRLLLMLETLKHRGPDYSNWKSFSIDSFTVLLGANRLAIVGTEHQPIHENNLTLVGNGEIYNYKEYICPPQSDLRSLLKLYQQIPQNNNTHTLLKEFGNLLFKKIDGFYSFILVDQNHGRIIIGRDWPGQAPLYYGYKDSTIVFGSEVKALNRIGIKRFKRIKPGTLSLITRDLALETSFMPYYQMFTQWKQTTEESIQQSPSYDTAKVQLTHLLTTAIKKRIPTVSYAVFLSGGIDSSLLTLLTKKISEKFSLEVPCVISVGTKSAKDIKFAEKFIHTFKLNFFPILINENIIEHELPRIIHAIETTNATSVAIAAPLYFAAQMAKELGIKVAFTGQGADELFIGYSHYRKHLTNTSHPINRTPQTLQDLIIDEIIKISSRNLERDNKTLMAQSVEPRLPYLDVKLVNYVIQLPLHFKIVKDNHTNTWLTKRILKDIAAKEGLDLSIIQRKKTAAQYGSGIMKLLKKVAKKNGFKFLKDYFEWIAKKHDIDWVIETKFR